MAIIFAQLSLQSLYSNLIHHRPMAKWSPNRFINTDRISFSRALSLAYNRAPGDTTSSYSISVYIIKTVHVFELEHSLDGSSVLIRDRNASAWILQMFIGRFRFRYGFFKLIVNDIGITIYSNWALTSGIINRSSMKRTRLESLQLTQCA